MVDWSDDRIAALSKQDLKNLLANAERKSAAEIVARCKAEMDKRDTSKPRKASKPRTELKEFEHAMSEQLAEIGKAMAAKYDLSEETAKARSAGVKGFKAHKLLDSNGHAKLGGMQRDGSVAVDRYISYRRGKDIVSIGVFLLKDQPVEAHEFHVIAPRLCSMVESRSRRFAPPRRKRRSRPRIAGLPSRIWRVRRPRSRRRSPKSRPDI